MVGADRLGQLERLRIAVDDDQLGGGEGFEHLNPDVAQAARADDDAFVARSQPPRRLGRSVVRGQPSVGQRSDVGRLKRVIDLHHAAR